MIFSWPDRSFTSSVLEDSLLRTMDRTQDWWHAVEQACKQQQIPEASILQLKSQMLIKRRQKQTDFMSATIELLNTIHKLRDYIKLHQQGYLSAGSYTEDEKDQIEVAVGAMVKECQQTVEQLKDSVAGSQRTNNGSSISQQHSVVNEQTTVHRLGTVLYMSEQLSIVSARFDKYRSQRHQQMFSKSAPLSIDLNPTRGQQAKSVPQSGFQGFRSNGNQHSSSGKLDRTGASPPKSASTALLQAAKLGGAVFTQVKGTTQAFLAGDSKHVSSPTAAQPHLDEQAQQPTGGMLSPQKQQQQLQLQAENNDLVAQLMDTASAVHTVERTVREIATLNQLFSAAVLTQAEAIETIYNNAAQASLNLKKGNQEIKKTIEVNKSSQRYVIVLLLVASLGLLFLDWFNS